MAAGIVNGVYYIDTDTLYFIPFDIIAPSPFPLPSGEREG
jgi:hypothetical protein